MNLQLCTSVQGLRRLKWKGHQDEKMLHFIKRTKSFPPIFHQQTETSLKLIVAISPKDSENGYGHEMPHPVIG